MFDFRAAAKEGADTSSFKFPEGRTPSWQYYSMAAADDDILPVMPHIQICFVMYM